MASLNIQPHRPPTKSGKAVLFTTLEDETDVLNLTCFGLAIDTCTATLLLAPAMLADGAVERQGNGANLRVERVKALHPEKYLADTAREIIGPRGCIPTPTKASRASSPRSDRAEAFA